MEMDKKVLLTEWHETAARKGDTYDAICQLAGSWAISTLLNELVGLAIQEHEALERLKQFGITDEENAFWQLMAYEQETD
jgi:hypothetical protein